MGVREKRSMRDKFKYSVSGVTSRVRGTGVMGRIDGNFLTQSIIVGKKKFNSIQPNSSYKFNLTHMDGLGRVKLMG